MPMCRPTFDPAAFISWGRQQGSAQACCSRKSSGGSSVSSRSIGRQVSRERRPLLEAIKSQAARLWCSLFGGTSADLDRSGAAALVLFPDPKPHPLKSRDMVEPPSPSEKLQTSLEWIAARTFSQHDGPRQPAHDRRDRRVDYIVNSLRNVAAPEEWPAQRFVPNL